MPKIINKYICRLCGAEYASEQTAKSCEDSHIRISGMCGCGYQRGQREPSSIVLRGSDNKTYCYTPERFMNISGKWNSVRGLREVFGDWDLKDHTNESEGKPGSESPD